MVEFLMRGGPSPGNSVRPPNDYKHLFPKQQTRPENIRLRRICHQDMTLLQVLLLIYLSTVAYALKCHQCNGWHGHYPARYSQVSTCDNRNNQCESQQYCVKIVDTMTPGVEYVTYKSDCFYQTQIQVNPQNLSFVQGKLCFPFQDGSAPVKRWFYCFCNDRDYCNATDGFSLMTSILISLVFKFVTL